MTHMTILQPESLIKHTYHITIILGVHVYIYIHTYYVKTCIHTYRVAAWYQIGLDDLIDSRMTLSEVPVPKALLLTEFMRLLSNVVWLVSFVWRAAGPSGTCKLWVYQLRYALPSHQKSV